MASNPESTGLLVDVEQQQQPQQQQQQQQSVRPSFETGVSFESAAPDTDDGGSHKESASLMSGHHSHQHQGPNTTSGSRQMSPDAPSQPASNADTARPPPHIAPSGRAVDMESDDTSSIDPPRYSGGGGRGIDVATRHFLLPAPVTSRYGYLRAPGGADSALDDADDPMHPAAAAGRQQQQQQQQMSLRGFGTRIGGYDAGRARGMVPHVLLLVPRLCLSLLWFSMYVTFGGMSILYLICWVLMQAITGFARVEWDKRMVRRDLGGIFEVLMDMFERIW